MMESTTNEKEIMPLLLIELFRKHWTWFQRIWASKTWSSNWMIMEKSNYRY
jgi:hypothetical protein